MAHSNNSLSFTSFADLPSALLHWKSDPFKALSPREQFRELNATLLAFIGAAQTPCFLLPSVIQFFTAVRTSMALHEPYGITNFEFWLNHFSGRSPEANRLIRGKIAGKFVPREEFAIAFPVGMNKRYAGSHYVTAHSSPDMDTTVASFWAWLDSFAARVGDALHHWSLPGGHGEPGAVSLFENLLGHRVFSYIAKGSGTLTLGASDLLTQEGVVKLPGKTLTSAIESHGNDITVVLVDDHGNYQGDWRNVDVERCRRVVTHFNATLRSFENDLHIVLIALFGREQVTSDQVKKELSNALSQQLKSSEGLVELTQRQLEQLQCFLTDVLHIPKGLDASFAELAEPLERLLVPEFKAFIQKVMDLPLSGCFENGKLVEHRPTLFRALEEVIALLDAAIDALRKAVDRLEIMIAIKERVMQTLTFTLSLRSDVDEMRTKIGNLPTLTVTIPNGQGKQFPVGVVRASDLRKNILGTVSMRDFCNLNEIKMSSYLEVISVVDHHRSTLTTTTAPLVMIADAQSCNALMAEQAFRINDRYSAPFPITLSEVTPDPSSLRIVRRELGRLQAQQNGSGYFVHPDREKAEYLTFLHAILDDTDLLSKVGNRDVEVVTELLNRLASLNSKEEREVVNLDGIIKDSAFAKKAAARLLQCDELYALCRETFWQREKDVNEQLESAATGDCLQLFSDTKVQNGCCRIGQTKVFANNLSVLEKYRDVLRKKWMVEAEKAYAANPDLDFHMHMISTIRGAEEVHSEKSSEYTHQDELWIWVSPVSRGLDHYCSFLNRFKESPEVLANAVEATFPGADIKPLMGLMEQNFCKIKMTLQDQKMPLVVLSVKAGTLNSRKSMITPYLPILLA